MEDALRAHPLISQAMAVGDAQPFIGVLIAIDPEAIESWKQHKGKDAAASVSDLRNDPDLIAEMEQAVKSANQHVSCRIDQESSGSCRATSQFRR